MIGFIFSAIAQATSGTKAASSAAEAQVEMAKMGQQTAREAMAEYRREYDNLIAQLKPYTSAGISSLNELTALLGLPGEPTGKFGGMEGATYAFKPGAFTPALMEEFYQGHPNWQKYMKDLRAGKSERYYGWGVRDKEYDKAKAEWDRQLQGEQWRPLSGPNAPLSKNVEEQIAQSQKTPATLAEIEQGYREIETGWGKVRLPVERIAGESGEARQEAALKSIEESPEFAEMVKTGEEAMLRRASVTGGLRGGNLEAALSQYAPQVLNQLVGQKIANLGGLTGLGQSSAAGIGAGGMQLGQAGLTNAQIMSNLYMQQGQAAAQSILGGYAAQQPIYAIPGKTAQTALYAWAMGGFPGLGGGTGGSAGTGAPLGGGGFLRRLWEMTGGNKSTWPTTYEV